MHVTKTTTGAEVVHITLDLGEARDLYLDLVQSVSYHMLAVDLRVQLKTLLGIKMCPVRNPNCKNEVTGSTYRVTCFNNHFRTRQYCSHHVTQIKNGLIDCSKCTEMGQRQLIVMLGWEK